MSNPGWYLHRLSRMGPAEIAGRATDVVRKRRWREVAEQRAGNDWLPVREFTPGIAGSIAGGIARGIDRAIASATPAAADRLVATADELMAGRAEYFGVQRADLVSPDWSFDPKTGRRAPDEQYAFDIAYRDERAIGDVKQIWEPSRHQHLTVLAAAFARTGDERYAERVADHLKSWWAVNPPMRGVHWISGIELGIRLLSWVWVRRLLDGWPGAPGLFEDNPEALHQIRSHQRWLAAFPSRGTSANNHVIAEAAGRLAASCAFPWFTESVRWRADALRSLRHNLAANTFGSGLNRELATEYHGLVLELGLAAAIEASAAGVGVGEPTWLVLRSMTDALAAIVDTRMRPPRQGDADDGYGLVVDGAGTDRWASLLATGGALFGRLDWWPRAETDDVRTPLLAALAGGEPRLPAAGRAAKRPSHLADAGLTVLRAQGVDGEIWCRCDGGPHGFTAIAAHAHADALSVEVRHDGIDLLADPGTYCYHTEPAWRSYFRSTLGHNTLRLNGTDQSTSGGPFLWTRHAQSRVLRVHTPQDGPATWSAEHDGYPAVHRRSVELDGQALRIVDTGLDDGPLPCELAFHLGPAVHAELAGSTARLSWTNDGVARTASLALPAGLKWTAHRGETGPPLGWYSPGFGRKVAAWTLLGTGQIRGGDELVTVLKLPRLTRPLDTTA